MRLESLVLNGFKSFGTDQPGADDGRRVEFGEVTVLVGANGAGKSNVVSFFRMVAFMMTGALQEYIQRTGTADSLLHYGAQNTPELSATLTFADEEARDSYQFTLAAAAPDTLIFTSEAVSFCRHEGPPLLERDGDTPGSPELRSREFPLGTGHRESLLWEKGDSRDPLCQKVLRLLRDCRPYHFHDTSDTAKIRKGGYIDDARYLRSDGGNLAAYLHALRRTHRVYYDRIVRTVQQVCPQFADFDLAPSEQNANYLRLNWREKHHPDCLMGPHQLSDGTLRFMALTTLYLQPPENAPAVAVLDEPELGLHPTALAALAGLIRSAAPRVQTILATESVTLVNQFDLDQVRPMTHSRGESRFLSLDPGDFTDWLDDYAAGDLWEQNVIGGGPRYE